MTSNGVYVQEETEYFVQKVIDINNHPFPSIQKIVRIFGVSFLADSNNDCFRYTPCKKILSKEIFEEVTMESYSKLDY